MALLIGQNKENIMTPDEYRESPIWGTDFSKSVTTLLEEIRTEMTKLRGKIYDIKTGYPRFSNNIDFFEGFLTTGISSMYNAIEDIRKIEIAMDDKKHGTSFTFKSRGIGSDSTPGCFVCGGKNGMRSNISAFVDSKGEGEMIERWFKQGARLDFRSSEPRYIQIKIGACSNHSKNLEKLHQLTGIHNVIRLHTIEESKKEIKVSNET